MHQSTALDSGVRRLTALPWLRRFSDEVTKILERGQDHFFECRAAFEQLVQGEFMEKLIQEELAAMALDPEYHPKDATDTHLMVLQTPTFTLRGLLVRDPSDQITLGGLAENLIFAVLGPGPLRLQRYLQPVPLPRDRLDRTRRLCEAEEQVLPRGTIGELRGLDEVPAFDPVDGVPTFVLMLASRPVSSIRWNYDRGTLTPKQMVSTDGTLSRLEYTIGLLAQLGHPSSADALGKLLHHPEHFIRWAALRALARVAPEMAALRLREAVADPHPYIRNAAVRSLARSGMQMDATHPELPTRRNSDGPDDRVQ